MSVTYYVAVPFDRDEAGALVAGEAREEPTSSAAERSAGALALRHARAVAFARSGDPTTGEFDDARLLAQFGAVDLDALSA